MKLNMISEYVHVYVNSIYIYWYTVFMYIQYIYVYIYSTCYRLSVICGICFTYICIHIYKYIYIYIYIYIQDRWRDDPPPCLHRSLPLQHVSQRHFTSTSIVLQWIAFFFLCFSVSKLGTSPFLFKLIQLTLTVPNEVTGFAKISSLLFI